MDGKNQVLWDYIVHDSDILRLVLTKLSDNKCFQIKYVNLNPKNIDFKNKLFFKMKTVPEFKLVNVWF